MTPADEPGEDAEMVDDQNRLDEVQRRLMEIQRRKRGRIRWRVSKNTAEMAIRALETGRPTAHVRSGKSRRRKRYKRLL
jgi:hypothetical protein